MASVRFKVIYLLLYSAYGSFFSYMPVYYRQRGLDASQVGVILALASGVGAVSSPIWCFVADVFNKHTTIFRINCLCSTLIRLLYIPFGGDFHRLLVAVVSSQFLHSAVSPILDAFVILLIPDPAQFGQLRLWGAVGFGLMSLISGIVASHVSIGYEASIYLSVGLAIGALALAPTFDFDKQRDEHALDNGAVSHVPQAHSEKSTYDEQDAGVPTEHTASPLVANSLITDLENGHTHLHDGIHARHREAGSLAETEVQIQSSPMKHQAPDHSSEDLLHRFKSHVVLEPEASAASSLTKLLEMMMDKHVICFTIILLVSGLANGMIETFLFVRLDEMGASGTLLGISRVLMCLGEIPFFQYNDLLVHHIGVFGVLALVQTAYIVRFTTYSLMTRPWQVLPIEALHGLTFASLWATSCYYAHVIAPPKLEASAQSIINVIHWGVGFTGGNVIGGIVWSKYGPVRMFQLGIALVSLTFMLAILTKMVFGERSTDTEEQDYHAVNTSSFDAVAEAVDPS